MLLVWQQAAAEQRARRRRLGAALARHCTHLLSAAVAHWRCFVLQRCCKAHAQCLAACCRRDLFCAKAMHAWHAFVAARGAKRDRENELAGAVAAAAAQVTRRPVLQDAANVCPLSSQAALNSVPATQQAGGQHREMRAPPCTTPPQPQAGKQRTLQQPYSSVLQAVRCQLAPTRSEYAAAKQALKQRVLHSRFRFTASAGDRAWAASSVQRAAPAQATTFPLLTRTAHGKRCGCLLSGVLHACPSASPGRACVQLPLGVPSRVRHAQCTLHEKTLQNMLLYR